MKIRIGAIGGLVLGAAVACSSAPPAQSLEGSESVGKTTEAVDLTVFPPTSYTITVTTEVERVQDIDPGSLSDPLWTADIGYSLWEELGVRVNQDNPYTTACGLGFVGTSAANVDLSACQSGAFNNGPFAQGQPLSARFTVNTANDVVTFALALDNLETTDPKAVTSSTGSVLATIGDSLAGVGTAVGVASGVGGAVIGIIGAAVSVEGDLYPAPGQHDPLFEASCAGGMMGPAPAGSSASADTLFIQLTPADLQRITATGGSGWLTKEATIDDGYCYSRVRLHFQIARDWGSGLAPSPKSGDSAVARHGNEADQLDEFLPVLGAVGAPANYEISHQLWNGSAWSTEVATPGASWITPQTNTASISRSPDKLDLFWIDGKGVPQWMAWSDGSGVWSKPGTISTQSLAPPNANITVAARQPGNLDVFFIGNDGGIWSSYWQEGASSWTTFELPGTAGLGAKGGGIAAVARTANNLDVFFVGYNGALWTSYWSAATGSWVTRNASEYQPNLAIPGAHVTATARTVNNLDVFFIGKDGGLYSTYWFNGAPDYVTFEVPGTSGLAQSGASLSAVSRQPLQLDVAFAGGGKMYVSSWSNGPWSTRPITSGNPYAAPSGLVSIVARSSWNLDVFYQDAFWDAYDAYWVDGMPSYGVTGPLAVSQQCVPKTCLGFCGTMADGCGGTLACGGRSGTQTCGGGGQPNVCATPPGLAALSIPSDVYEGDTNTATVFLDRPAPQGGLAVSLSNSAPAGGTLTVTAPTSVVVPQGATSASFTFAAVSFAPPQTFTFTALVDGTTLTSSVAVHAQQSLTMATGPVWSGKAASVVMTLHEALPSSTVVFLSAVDQPTSGAAGTVSLPSAITIPAGKVAVTFPVTLTTTNPANDVKVTASLGGVPASTTFHAFLGNVAVTTAGSMLTPDDTTTGTVYLRNPAPTGGETLMLVDSQPTWVVLPASVTVPAGATSAQFEIDGGAIPPGTNGRVTITAGMLSNKGSTSIRVWNITHLGG